MVVRDPLGRRVKPGSHFSLNRLELPSWTTKGARVVATFEDGSPAISTNKFRQGTVITIFTDVSTAAQNFPELMRDVLDYAVAALGNSPLVDIVGTSENSDIAVGETANGFRVGIVNYKAVEIDVILKPVRTTTASEWLDLVNNNAISKEISLKLRVPGYGFRAVEFRGK